MELAEAQGMKFSAAVLNAIYNTNLVDFVHNIYHRNEAGRFEPIIFDKYSDDKAATVYSGLPLVIEHRGGQPTSVLPSIALTAAMLTLLDARPGMRILEIGTGTGYLPALLAKLTGSPALVTSIDQCRECFTQKKVALESLGFEGIKLIHGDGFYGDRDNLKYDRIIVNCGCPDISPHWFNQLKQGEIAIAPVNHGGWFPIIKLKAADSDIVTGLVVHHAGVTMNRLVGAIGHGATNSMVQVSMSRDLREVKQDGLATEILSGRRDVSAIRDFWFFLCANEDVAIMHLVDERSGDLVARGAGFFATDSSYAASLSENYSLIGFGDALQRLSDLNDQFLSLGQPRVSHYKLTFLAKSNDRVPSDKEWVIRRKYFDEFVSLTAR